MLVQRLGTPSDFDPLLERVRDARVVMIGEATHGSYDYYRLREQLTRRLIAERGFSFVAVEGDWPDCDRVHRSVIGAPGGARGPADRAGPVRALADLDVGQRRGGPVLPLAAGVEPGASGAGTGRLPRAGRVQPLGVMQAIFDYLGEEDPKSMEAAQDAYRLLRAVRQAGRGVRRGQPVRLGPLRGGGGPAAGRTRGHAVSDGPDASRPGRTRRWWPARSGTTGRWWPAGRIPGTSATPTCRTPWTGCWTGTVPDAPGDRLGAQHPHRGRPCHRHGRRRDGQHRPVGPGTARPRTRWP